MQVITRVHKSAHIIHTDTGDQVYSKRPVLPLSCRPEVMNW